MLSASFQQGALVYAGQLNSMAQQMKTCGLILSLLRAAFNGLGLFFAEGHRNEQYQITKLSLNLVLVEMFRRPH